MRSLSSLGPNRNYLAVLAAGLLVSGLAGASGASCAAGTELGTGGSVSSSSSDTSTASASTTTSSTSASSGGGGASTSSSGSGGASSSGSGGASSSSSSGSGGGASSSSTGVGGGGVDAGTDAGTGGGGTGGGDGGTPLGVLVMLAGGGATVLAGEYHPGAGWTTSSLADMTGTTDGPAVALTGPTSAIGLIRSTPSGELRSTSWAPGSWANFAALGAGVTTHTTPSLTASGTLAEAAFLGDDFKHYYAAHPALWAPVAEPIGGAAAQSFGPSPAAITALGADAVVAYAGNNGDLYDQTRDAGAWLGAHAHNLGNVVSVTPAIIAPTAGPDLMVVFVRKPDEHILYTTRTGAVWTAPVLLDANALTGDPVSLVALPGGRAVAAYRGTDTKLYFSRFDPAAMPPWSVPAAVFTPNVVTPSTPALTVGLPGADAELVYIDSGAAKHARLSGTIWSPAVTIGGAGLTHAAASGLAM